MQVVILCGGKATRLHPLTKKIPKSMIKIADRPFLEHQLDLLKKNGFENILLCVGHKAKQIKDYFGNSVKYSRDELLGTGGALKNAEKILEDTFLVMYGDSYLLFDFQKAIKFFQKSNKLGLMTVFKNINRYEISNVKIKKELVLSYSNKRKDMEYIDYGVSIFQKQILKCIPQNKFFDLSQLHKLLIKKKELLAYEVKQRFYQIGTPEGLKELCLLLEHH